MKKYAENYFQIRIKSLVEVGLKNVTLPRWLHMQFPSDEEPIYLQAFVTPKENYYDITFMFDMSSIQARIIFTETNYGGKRFWFLCPITWEKCTVLFWRWKEIWSRKWLGLKYLWDCRDKLFLYLDVNRDYGGLLETIKYPYRNGKPTKKFKRVLRGYKKAWLTEKHAYEALLFARQDYKSFVEWYIS